MDPEENEVLLGLGLHRLPSKEFPRLPGFQARLSTALLLNAREQLVQLRGELLLQ